jgi:hypothetical protein
MAIFSAVLAWFKSKLCPCPRSQWVFSIGQFQIQFSGEFFMRLTTEQKTKATVKPLTPAGNPAVIDGEITYQSSNPDVASISDDGVIVALSVGATRITASFDADLGDGIRLIELSGSIEVVLAEASTGVLAFAEPELQ